MALMQVDYFSETLRMACQANVILPQKEQGIGVTGSGGGERYPVLWLLHGASDDHTIWLRRTSIERYVAPLGIAVVMPSAHLSSYSNMAHGPAYKDYFLKELPALMGEMFPLSGRREDNFIAGLSMGGFGSLKLGLSAPDQFAAIGCFSAGNFVRSGRPRQPSPRLSGKPSRQMALYGTENMAEVVGSPEFDLYTIAENAIASGKPLPRIFHACGRSDWGIENARATAGWFEAHREFDYLYKEGEGVHDWAFWDEWIQHFLRWLFPGQPAGEEK